MYLYFIWNIARPDDVCWVLLLLTRKIQDFQGINVEIHVRAHIGTNVRAREHATGKSFYFLKTCNPIPERLLYDANNHLLFY